MKKVVTILLVTLFIISCRISYQFNGASIDYNLVKTIEIRDFPNQAATVYPPLSQVFSETVRDHFTKNTRLEFTNTNPDLELEGEIVRYDLTSQSVKEQEGGRGIYATETRLTMSVRIRYMNNKKPEENKEETITAYRDFSSTRMFTEVQDELIDQLSQDIADQIFNVTMSNW